MGISWKWLAKGTGVGKHGRNLPVGDTSLATECGLWKKDRVREGELPSEKADYSVRSYLIVFLGFLIFAASRNPGTVSVRAYPSQGPTGEGLLSMLGTQGEDGAGASWKALRTLVGHNEVGWDMEKAWNPKSVCGRRLASGFWARGRNRWEVGAT